MAKQKFGLDAAKARIANKQINKESDLSMPDQSPNQVESLNEQLMNTTMKIDYFEVKLIPRQKIKPNPKNKFSLRDIESLKDSILQYGLQQNLAGIYLMDTDIYILEIGHRRMEAIDQLINTFSDYDGNEDDENYQLYLQNVASYEKGYPFKVNKVIKEDIIYIDVDDSELPNVPDEVLDSEIRLEISNFEVRNLDEEPTEKASNIRRLGKLLDEKNRRAKRSDRINVNKNLAKHYAITERQIINIRSTDKLIPELQAEFDKHTISLTNATAYAKLAPEEQQVILTILTSGRKVTEEEIKLLRSERELAIKEQTKLAQQLTQKEEELTLLKNTLLNSNNEISTKTEDSVLQQQDIRIKNLKKEIAVLKKQANKPATATLSPEITSILKDTMSIKSNLELSQKNLTSLIKDFTSYIKKYDSLPATQKEELGILSKEDILNHINTLEKIITSWKS